jgi:hypothetical protein
MILSAYALPNMNRERLVQFLEPGGSSSLTIGYRKHSFVTLWSEAVRPLKVCVDLFKTIHLKVFDAPLWIIQICIFILGVGALTLSRYMIKSYASKMAESAINSATHVRTRISKIFTDRLFQYYSVVVAQGRRVEHTHTHTCRKLGANGRFTCE